MKFYELPNGTRFKFNNQEYVKIKEVKLNCCKVKENAQLIETGEKKVLKALDEVEKIA